MEETFSCDVVNNNEEDDYREIDFDSRWTFPSEEMEQLTVSLSNADDLYIRVLSYEFGNDYVAYNIYTSGEWCDKLADRY
ncbi:MAG: hypothetical protein LBN93_00240 [Candidatus Symbiothrix sp.]|nr:hypothetical protein [Candidatus Symbiothrix sp.]